MAVLVALLAGFALLAALVAVGLKAFYSTHTYWGRAAPRNPTRRLFRGRRRYRARLVTSFEARFWRQESVHAPRISDISRQTSRSAFGDEQHVLTAGQVELDVACRTL